MSDVDVFADAPVAMAVAAADGRLLRANTALCDLLGYPADDLVGRTLDSFSHPHHAGHTGAELRALRAGTAGRVQFETQYINASGRPLWVLLAASLAGGDSGAPSFVVHLQDFSERHALAERMVYLADHDALTGLFSRRRFERILARHRQAMLRYDADGALLLIDLDQFKSVNDRLGHQAGDDVLKSVSAALNRRLRESDVVARLGGDEFAVLLPHADSAQAQRVAADLVREVERTQTVVGSGTVAVTASIGVVSLAGTAASDNAAALADAAMYRAKRSGGNRWMAAAPGDSPRSDAPESAGARTSMPAWVGRAVSSRRTQVTLACAAALIVATRYGVPNPGELVSAPQSLVSTLGRALALFLGPGQAS